MKILTSAFVLLFLSACAPGTSASPTPLPDIGQEVRVILLTGGEQLDRAGVVIESRGSSVRIAKATRTTSWGGVTAPPRVGAFVRGLERQGGESPAFEEPRLVVAVEGDSVSVAMEWNSMWIDWAQVMAWGD